MGRQSSKRYSNQISSPSLYGWTILASAIVGFVLTVVGLVVYARDSVLTTILHSLTAVTVVLIGVVALVVVVTTVSVWISRQRTVAEFEKLKAAGNTYHVEQRHC
jgi:hypothetical protein